MQHSGKKNFGLLISSPLSTSKPYTIHHIPRSACSLKGELACPGKRAEKQILFENINYKKWPSDILKIKKTKKKPLRKVIFIMLTLKETRTKKMDTDHWMSCSALGQEPPIMLKQDLHGRQNQSCQFHLEA